MGMTIELIGATEGGVVAASLGPPKTRCDAALLAARCARVVQWRMSVQLIRTAGCNELADAFAAHLNDGPQPSHSHWRRP